MFSHKTIVFPQEILSISQKFCAPTQLLNIGEIFSEEKLWGWCLPLFTHTIPKVHDFISSVEQKVTFLKKKKNGFCP